MAARVRPLLRLTGSGVPIVRCIRVSEVPWRLLARPVSVASNSLKKGDVLDYEGTGHLRPTHARTVADCEIDGPLNCLWDVRIAAKLGCWRYSARARQTARDCEDHREYNESEKVLPGGAARPSRHLDEVCQMDSR